VFEKCELCKVEDKMTSKQVVAVMAGPVAIIVGGSEYIWERE